MYRFGGASQINQGGGQLQVGQGSRQDLQAGTLLSPIGGAQRGLVTPSTSAVLPSQVAQQQQQARATQILNASQSTVSGANPGQNRPQSGSTPAPIIPIPANTQAAPYFPTYSASPKSVRKLGP